MLRVGYQPWGQTLSELVAAARAAEDAGAAVIWLPELHRSSTVTAAAVGSATASVTVATGVALAFTRSPMTLALEALDLQELTGNRFRLGLGSGTRRVNTEWHAAEFDHPVERLRETVSAIRTFWCGSAAGGTIEAKGELRPMRIVGYRRAAGPVGEAIPIHLAAVGTRMLRLAGEVADGWLAHELCTPTYVRSRALPELERGLAASGRGRASLEVTASAVCAVADDREAASAFVAGHVGFYAGVRAYASFFDLHGLLEEHQQVSASLRAGVPADAMQASARMRETLAIAGTPDDVMERIAAYEGIADAIKLSPPVHGLAPDEIRAAQAALIALIRDLHR